MIRSVQISILAVFLCNLCSRWAAATPVANPDTYTTGADQQLAIPATTGVLQNDSGVGALSATLEDDVSNGSLTLEADGSFSYTPAPGFSGTDSFTYRTSEMPSGSQVFTIVENSSNATVDAELTVDGLGSDSDSDTTKLRGTLTATITPTQSPFSQIHITDFQVRTAENVGLSFSFFFGLAGVNASADAEAIMIEMATPGAASTVDLAGNFSQLQNEVSMAGTVAVEGTGLAAGQVPEGDQVFESTGEFLDLTGTLTQQGGSSRSLHRSPIKGLSTSTATRSISASPATSSPPPRLQQAIVSPPTTVTITVTPPAFIDTDNDGMDDRWELANGLEVGTDDSSLDQDGDGSTSFEEFLAATDPQDPTSVLKILGVSVATGARASVRFSSTPGKTYQLQQSPDLGTGFADLPGISLTATAEESNLNVSLQSVSRGYLRVIVIE